MTVATEWVRNHPGFTYRNEWRTTVPGVMSVIDVYSKKGDVYVTDIATVNPALDQVNLTFVTYLNFFII